ncbi:uncharacterized protein A1O9_12812, partial [Exophiala aquamarina CBS 119918]
QSMSIVYINDRLGTKKAVSYFPRTKSVNAQGFTVTVASTIDRQSREIHALKTSSQCKTMVPATMSSWTSRSIMAI